MIQIVIIVLFFALAYTILSNWKMAAERDRYREEMDQANLKLEVIGRKINKDGLMVASEFNDICDSPTGGTQGKGRQ